MPTVVTSKTGGVAAMNGKRNITPQSVFDGLMSQWGHIAEDSVCIRSD